jgi:type 1 fimbria pilin
MDNIFKISMLPSLFLIASSTYAAAPSATVTITGTITPSSNCYEMNAPITLDLGSVILDDFEKTAAASEAHSKPLTIEVSKGSPGQIVQFHLNANQDKHNNLMIANSTDSGYAINAGIVIHEHINGTSRIITPIDGVATQNTVDENGNVRHEFMVSMTPIQDGYPIVPGKISASATFTVESV